MSNESRRTFLKMLRGAAVALPSSSLVGAPAEEQADGAASRETVSLNGAWRFRFDPQNRGESEEWFAADVPPGDWTEAMVPHTWQIEPASSDYMGVAWYRRNIAAPDAWVDRAARVEFEAVFHSATAWLNGKLIGEHTGRGYTAFTFDAVDALKYGSDNVLAVRVDNAFNGKMLPRGTSSDWTHDGGIYRPVSLLVTPKAFVERADVDAIPAADRSSAVLEITVALRNTAKQPVEDRIRYRVIDVSTGQIVHRYEHRATVKLQPESSQSVSLPASYLPRPKLWHFDHPNLYELIVTFGRHEFSTIFGARSIEIKDGGFYLNGERVFLMGVERMAGSNPNYGMAEPSSWLVHDHNDLKELNCVFTRVHWQQDKRVLDYCDRHGILIQEEVPTWGGGTFAGMTGEPSPEIMENGLEQLREMIHRDRNHPSIFAWGPCNEIGGQNPPAYEFARRMYEEAKRLDPRRLRSYASNSLEETPEKDVAGRMDFIEWNEYYETWMKGTVEDMQRNLDEIHRAFPDKMIVISEYGYCACTPERPEDDTRRIEILKEHDNAFRERDCVGGLIFFCYNDYRTHVGDKGKGVLKQRVHGVVDLYGARKPSFDELRRESSPVASVEIAGEPGSMVASIRTRHRIPAYRLMGYQLRWIVYSGAGIPVEEHVAALPRLEPGEEARVSLRFEEKAPSRVVIDVMRPTGFSAWTTVWRT